MLESKKKRLEEKGWKFGTATEFLQLTTEEAAYVELRIKLSNGLKQRRQKQCLTQAQLADLIKSSQS